jgi:hypothetical protein
MGILHLPVLCRGLLSGVILRHLWGGNSCGAAEVGSVRVNECTQSVGKR